MNQTKVFGAVKQGFGWKASETKWTTGLSGRRANRLRAAIRRLAFKKGTP